MSKNEYRKITIEGETTNDVQGTNLRDRIEKIGNELNAGGFVRNIKGEAIVEIICEADKAKQFHEKLKELKKRKSELFRIKEIKEPSGKLFDKFDRFRIIREDDLTEMVWGLLGAGRSFQFAEKMRESQRKSRLLTGLKQELTSISNQLDCIKGGDLYYELRTFCIEHFLKEPPNDMDNDLLTSLSDLCDTCYETNSLVRKLRDWKLMDKDPSDKEKLIRKLEKSRFEENLKRISSLATSIDEKIDKNNK